MTAITALEPLVYSKVPMAPTITINRMLVEAIRDFCDYTRAWRTTISETVTADTLGVTVTPPTDGELVDVVKASLDGSIKLGRRTQEQLDDEQNDWRTDSGTASFYTLGDDVNEVLIAPMSATTYTNGLELRCAWKPVLGATTIDTLMVSKYSDVFVAGAIARLLMDPDEPYSNPDRAGYYATVFMEGREDAKQQASDGRMKGVVRKIKYGGL